MDPRHEKLAKEVFNDMIKEGFLVGNEEGFTITDKGKAEAKRRGIDC